MISKQSEGKYLILKDKQHESVIHWITGVVLFGFNHSFYLSQYIDVVCTLIESSNRSLAFLKQAIIEFCK